MKLNLDKEWFAARIAHEDGVDVGAGPLAPRAKAPVEPVPKMGKTTRRSPVSATRDVRAAVTLASRHDGKG